MYQYYSWNIFQHFKGDGVLGIAHLLRPSDREIAVVLGGTTVLPWNRGKYRGTAVLLFHGTMYCRGHGTTVVPQCHKYRGTIPYGTCKQMSFQRRFACENAFLRPHSCIPMWTLRPRLWSASTGYQLPNCQPYRSRIGLQNDVTYLQS